MTAYFRTGALPPKEPYAARTCRPSRSPPGDTGRIAMRQPGTVRNPPRGALGCRWASWLDGLSLTSGSGGTVIHGPVADQAAPYGLLQKVPDMGLPLVSVTQVQPGCLLSNPVTH
jgi:hypothetical protein